MPDFTPTPSLVISFSTPNQRGISKVAINAGQLCSFDTVTQKWELALATALATVNQLSIALNSAEGADQPIDLGNAIDVVLGSGVLTAGKLYVASAVTAGALAEWTDLGTGHFPSFAGWAVDGDTLRFRRYASGIALPA